MTAHREQDAAVLLSRRAIRAGLLTIALLAGAAAFLSDGSIAVVCTLFAVAALFYAIRGLPEVLIDHATRRRTPRYVKAVAVVLPVGFIFLSAYIAFFLVYVLRSSIPIGLRLELPLALVLLAGLFNIGVAAFNLISSSRD
jgi:succinate dehydrogenase hydrophobic anchor subunit